MTGLTKYERICQPLLAIIACGLNFPSVVVGLMAAANWCSYYGNFLAPNAVLSVVNIFAAFYSIYELRKQMAYDLKYNGEAENDEEDWNANSTRNNATASAPLSLLPTNPSDYEEAESNRTKIDSSEATLDHADKSNGDDNDDNDHDEDQQKDVESADTFPYQLPSPAHAQEADMEITDNITISQQLPKETPTNNNPISPEELEISNPSSMSLHHHSCFKHCVDMRTTSSNRIRYLVCYNGLITTYSILFLFWAFWLGSGEQMALQVDEVSPEKLEECSDKALQSQYRHVHLSVALGYAYFSFVMLCLIASYCDPE